MRRNRFAWIFAAAATLVIAGCGSEQEEVTLSAAQERAVAERLAPEGQVAMQGDAATAPAAAASAGGADRTPEEIYNAHCMACHTTGAAGAPKKGEAGDWEPRVAQGMDVVYEHTITGIRGMPPRGLCMTCSDDDLKAVVDWILEQH